MKLTTTMRLCALALLAMLAGCASNATPEPVRETARTAATPEVNPCRQSGRTTMVRGECTVDWEGEIVRISGDCDVTPGRTQEDRPCLRLSISAGDCSVNAPGRQTSSLFVDPSLLVMLTSCRELDATLLKNGDLFGTSEEGGCGAASSGSIALNSPHYDRGVDKTPTCL